MVSRLCQKVKKILTNYIHFFSIDECSQFYQYCFCINRQMQHYHIKFWTDLLLWEEISSTPLTCTVGGSRRPSSGSGQSSTYGFKFYFCCCQSSFKSTLLYSLMTRLYRNIGTSINLHLYVHVCMLKRLSNTLNKQPRKIFCNLSLL